MVLEVAEFRIVLGRQTEFEAAFAHAVASVMRRAAGAGRVALQRCIETPGRYLLFIEWDTLEAHTVGFRQSALFAEWRAIIGPFFAEPPRVEHFEQAMASEA